MRKLAIPVGLIGFLGLLAAGIWWSVPKMENDLTVRAEQALASEEITGLDVSFDGRNGKLTGVADLAGAERADALVEGVDGVRFATVNAATPVTEAPPVTEPAEQVVIDAVYVEDTKEFVIEGAVESDETRGTLLDDAAGPARVVDGLEVSSDVESRPEEIEAVRRLLQLLANGAEPELHYTPGEVELGGKITQEGAEEQLNEAIAAAKQVGLRVTDKTQDLDLAQQTDELDEKIADSLARAQAEKLEGDLADKRAFFEVNSAQLIPAGQETLDVVVVSLRQYPLPKVMVVGHTDPDGADQTNLALSNDRANSARTYLIDAQARDEIEALGRGELDVGAVVREDGEDEATHKFRQRRIEFAVGEDKIAEITAKPGSAAP